MDKNKRDAEGEHEIDTFKANRYRNLFETDGGELTLTNKRLVFHPHALNFDTSDTEIWFDDITSVTRFNTLGFLPNGVVVEMPSGEVYKFVVWQREKVIETIKNHLPKVKRHESSELD